MPYPEHLSRGLVLIKWWLLAIPQYVIIALLAGGVGVAAHLWGLIAILTLFAAFALIFTSRYPRGIFDFVMGLNRWVFRVLVYVLLMRDEYPPFRFDPGGSETPPMPSAPPAPAAGCCRFPRPSEHRDALLSSSEIGEEGGNVRCEKPRLLGGSEMSTARHLGPSAHVVQALGPLARWPTLEDELLREVGDPGGHRDECLSIRVRLHPSGCRSSRALRL